jgi:hypothetical protein
LRHKILDRQRGDSRVDRVAIRLPTGHIPNMRVVIGGDACWRCVGLALAVLRRPLVRYRPEIIIAHAGKPGIDQSFSLACLGKC